MKRKVVKHGSNTMTISLPSNWVKRHEIKQGDELEMTEKEGHLKIFCKTEKLDNKTIKLKFNKKAYARFLALALTSAYIKGYDTMIIEFEDKECYNIIIDKMKRLIGFDVVEKKEKSCIIKNIMMPTDKEYDTILRRSLFLIIENQEIIKESLIKNDFNNFEQIKENVDKIRGYCNYCRRYIIRIEDENVETLFLIHTRISDMAKNQKHLYTYLANNKIRKASDELIEINDKITRDFRSIMDIFYSKKTENSDQVMEDINDTLKKDIFNLLNNSKDDKILLWYMGHFCRLNTYFWNSVHFNLS